MVSLLSRLLGIDNRSSRRTKWSALSASKKWTTGRCCLERLEDRTVLSSFGNFQIDGDLNHTTNTTNAAFDWDNLNTNSTLPRLDTIQSDTFNSTTDDQFVGGAKESDPMRNVSFGPSPSKADLTRMYVGHNAIPNVNNPNGNDVLLYLGFNRFSNTGDTFNGFELNQSTATNNYNAGNGFLLPRRTAGDLLITFDFSSSSVQIGLLKWTGNDTSGNWVNPDTNAVGVPQGFGVLREGYFDLYKVHGPARKSRDFRAFRVHYRSPCKPLLLRDH
jgi:hypothetical protein